MSKNNLHLHDNNLKIDINLMDFWSLLLLLFFNQTTVILKLVLRFDNMLVISNHCFSLKHFDHLKNRTHHHSRSNLHHSIFLSHLFQFACFSIATEFVFCEFHFNLRLEFVVHSFHFIHHLRYCKRLESFESESYFCCYSYCIYPY